MYEYSFKVNALHFKIHAEGDKEAVAKARRAIEESFNLVGNYLEIQLTAGAFMGRLYITTKEITMSNIYNKKAVLEQTGSF